MVNIIDNFQIIRNSHYETSNNGLPVFSNVRMDSTNTNLLVDLGWDI